MVYGGRIMHWSHWFQGKRLDDRTSLARRFGRSHVLAVSQVMARERCTNFTYLLISLSDLSLVGSR